MNQAFALWAPVSIFMAMTISACGGSKVADACGPDMHRDQAGVCTSSTDTDGGASSEGGIHWDGGPVPNEMHGTIGGRAVSGAYVNVGQGEGVAPFLHSLSLTISSSPMLCTEGADYADPSETRLYIALFERYPGATMRVAPGVMRVVSSELLSSAPEEAVAIALFISNRGTGTCSAYIEDQVDAVSGSVTLYEVSGDGYGFTPALTGRFDLQFANGSLSGSFTAHPCTVDQSSPCRR